LRVDIDTSALASPNANAEAEIDPDTDDVDDEVLPALDAEDEPSEDSSVESFSDGQLQYASAVGGVDDIVGTLCAYLREHRLTEDTMIVMTSFRGADTGEVAPFRKWNPPFLHEELVHVPLIIRMPGGADAGRRIDILTQPCDLLPTLGEAFGFPTDEVNGHSLLPLIAGKTTIIREFACSHAISDRFELRAIRNRDWCLVESLLITPTAYEGDLGARRTLLFEKPADRWEVSDLSNLHPDTVEQLQTVMNKLASAPQIVDVAAEHNLKLPGSEVGDTDDEHGPTR
jgi:arylsulfatase A-like enzyme